MRGKSPNSSTRLQQVLTALRTEVPPLGKDRYLAPEIETAAAFVRSGTVASVAGLRLHRRMWEDNFNRIHAFCPTGNIIAV
ncbi:MAG: hypothetical protein J4F49_13500 [Rhodobacteraceae bacterium]|nr:hypothetical protein [Paracoccaceae bacterium]